MALCTRQVSASEIARRIGVSRAVLYKWKDEIIGNSAYRAMRKHNEPSLEAERDVLREEVARLNQEIRRQQMELDILKKAEEIIKKDPGISISHLNNREKTKIADALRQTYPLTELLHVLGLARSSYFYHRAALKAGDNSYQRHFMSCNKYESFTDLCENTVLLTDDIKLTVEENITPEKNLLEFLKKNSDNIFVYYARERASDNLVWYTKIVSPDFFYT